MGLFDHFPYTNFHELNLDWILNALRELEHTIDQFVSINALKYADPIQWNIVSQYEKNTIVIDPLTGTAYISVQAVPSGVALTNTDYWTVVFDLGSFVVRAAKNLANTYEAETTLTATVNTSAGEWLVWGDTLYKALVNITAGDTYVIDGNITKFTIQDVVGNMDTLSTTDKSNIVNAINELYQAISTLSDNIGNLDDIDPNIDSSSIVNAINDLYTAIGTAIINIVGDRDDLNTTDKSTIVNAINEVLSDVVTLNNKVDSLISFVDLTSYDVSGSDNEYYGAINLGSTLLSMAGANDYKVGYGLLIERAGNVPTLSPVSSFTATYTGTAGAITHEYAISKITRNFGCTPAVTAIVSGCSALDANNYVTLNFTQDPDAYAYLLYRDNVLVDILSQNIAGGMIDWNLTAITIPFNVPNTPPAGYVNEYLKAKVVSVSGNDITIDTTAKNGISGAKVVHDDTDEIQKAINENELLYIPKGTYNISITSGVYCLYIPSNRELYGDGNLSVLNSKFGIAHGAMLFNSCNVFGGTNTDITIRKLKINTGAINTDHVSGISFRIPAIYMAANDINNRPTRITVKDMVINGVSGGITFASIVEGLISHNSITNCIADGSGCYDRCENCVIEYNTIYNTGDDSIGISNQVLNSWNSNIKCIGNSCTRTGAHGIRVEGNGITVQNNYVEYTALDGIYVHKYAKTLTQLISVLGNKITRVHDYTGGIAGNVSGTFYNIALRDDAGASPYGNLSQVSIIGNNLNDTDSIGIIGSNATNVITNVQIAANPTIAGGHYEVSGVLTPNNIHSFSQKVSGSFTVSAIANTAVTHSVSYSKLPMIPNVSLTRRNGVGGDTFNYFISNITDTGFTVVVVSANSADFIFDYTVTC